SFPPVAPQAARASSAINAPRRRERSAPRWRWQPGQPGAVPDVSDPDRAGPHRNTRDRTIRLTAIRADNERLGAVYQITAAESSQSSFARSMMLVESVIDHRRVSATFIPLQLAELRDLQPLAVLQAGLVRDDAGGAESDRLVDIHLRHAPVQD